MLLTKLKRVIKSGFISFWRNSFISIASILVMTMALSVIVSLIFISAIFSSTLEQIKDKVDINVYFTTVTDEESILALKASIEALPEVEKVEYISREEALEQFRERYRDDQSMLQALDELGENPLRAVLNIKAKEPSQYEGIAEFLKDESALSSGVEASIIDKVNYFQNKVAIDKLSKIIDSSEKFGIIVTIMLIIISVIITFNTIRLVIFTSREEISVMRLVGASNTYIRGPFVVEGIMYGVASAIITLIIFYPLTLWLGPVAENFFSNINIFDYYMDHFVQIFLIITGSGILLGAISSYLAVKKYLKV